MVRNKNAADTFARYPEAPPWRELRGIAGARGSIQKRTIVAESLNTPGLKLPDTAFEQVPLDQSW
jgi:hypothetical protein